MVNEATIKRMGSTLGAHGVAFRVWAPHAQKVSVIGVPAAGPWKLRFNSDWQGYDDDFGNHPSTDVTAESGVCDGLPWHAAVSIGPYSMLVFSQ